MVQVPQRTALSGPALIRLLARLTDLDVPESSQSLSDRLSQWLGWTDAIALSAALAGSTPAVNASVRASGSAEDKECVRVRSSLASMITSDPTFAPARQRRFAQAQRETALVETTSDYAVFRQRYLSLQQSMETGVGNLRGHLRTLLAARTPASARLAVVDAAMERALGPRERTLLAAVPELLGGHFERLHRADQAARANAEAQGETVTATPGGAWLDVFRHDARSVLLAELDVRFQPAEGLLAALRAS
ncbi:DUF3348 domain-containing protein [Paraburkholderia sp. DHOC27]|uniref:DUF3348 domain-containing protein n=1 Tax=Paraburkholderia sp. DHOC27 TaxID=2303330 RepID=UPI000E3E0F8A|nr:DUF3348 domain-containing protein [Paraburkholderia sp. DHOC27]RFU46282.1 DUF3348 domain-containing protein [Paraburkholderia sp. DHOC27]